jgi:hypothetical protein
MLSIVEIENTEGDTLLAYKNPVKTGEGKRFVYVEKHGDLTYKAYFKGEEEDRVAGRDVAHALIQALDARTEDFVEKKHANVYAYIDNYLNARNPVYPIPRRVKKEMFGGSRVFVDVEEVVYKRSRRGSESHVGYGQVRVRPEGEVGKMCLKIDSRSTCSFEAVRYHGNSRLRREGLVSLLELPPVEGTALSYSFGCNEKDFAEVLLTLTDAQKIELKVDPSRWKVSKFRTEIRLGESVGNVTVHCLKGKSGFLGNSSNITWEVEEMCSAETLSILTSANHKSLVSLTYSYEVVKAAASGILICSLSSSADENWIKHVTTVHGSIRAGK